MKSLHSYFGSLSNIQAPSSFNSVKDFFADLLRPATPAILSVSGIPVEKEERENPYQSPATEAILDLKNNLLEMLFDLREILREGECRSDHFLQIILTTAKEYGIFPSFDLLEPEMVGRRLLSKFDRFLHIRNDFVGIQEDGLQADYRHLHTAPLSEDAASDIRSYQTLSEDTKTFFSKLDILKSPADPSDVIDNFVSSSVYVDSDRIGIVCERLKRDLSRSVPGFKDSSFQTINPVELKYILSSAHVGYHAWDSIELALRGI